MSETARVSALFTYPVKGCHGVALEQSPIGPRGLTFDREWMVVDGDGVFISQRSHPKLSQVQVSVGASGLRLSAEGVGEVVVAHDAGGARVPVRIWRAELDAVRQTPEADAFFSELLGDRLSFVRFARDVVRPCDPAFAQEGDNTTFSDGYPLLVTSEASLAKLNDVIVSRGGDGVPMSRFRPNIVVVDAPADIEDSNRRLMINQEMKIDLVKPCSRCAVTTVDQETGQRMGKEPLKSMVSYRQGFLGDGDREVYFGQNGVARVENSESNRIAVGDAAEFVSR